MAPFDPAWIDDAFELLEASPVRRAKEAGRSLPEPAALDAIDEIPRRLGALRERVANPLTLAVLGEVKAGKSTLINALVGVDVAPVDVLEATRWVMEIRHGPIPHALIRFTDGSVREGTPGEIHDLLFAERENAEFMDRCAEVIVSLPEQTLTRLHLIDTPGLATVTEEAAARTRHHLTQVDTILWVLNANHLGQLDVVEEMAEVARLGKPIVAVINRIDEADTDPSRLVRYVRTGLAEYVQDVFAVSARQARHAQREGDLSLLEESGVPRLRAFLEEQMDQRASEAQAEALSQQLLALLHLEHTLHKTYSRQLGFLIQEADTHAHRLDVEKRRIETEVRAFVERELEDYFRGVTHEFIQRVPESRGLDSLLSGLQPKDFEEDLRDALAGRRFGVWVEELASRVQAFIRKKWEEAAGQMEVEMRDRFQTFYAGEARRLDAVEGLDGSSDLLAGLKEGLAAGGVIGAGLAFYSAVLGPGAAAITMGTALSAFLPPALMVGALTGIVLRLLQSKQQAEKLRTGIRDAVVRHQRVVQSEWVEPVLVPAMAEYNNAIADHLARAFTDRLCHGWTNQELKALARDLDGYLGQCRQLHQRLESHIDQRTR